MEKKFKFSDNPSFAKAIYGIVIGLLCVTAIIVGIVAANSRKKTPTEDKPPISDNVGNESGDQNGNENPDDKPDDKPDDNKDAVTFISPVAGTVIKGHSLTVPVYSETLEAWRVHTGIDISVAEGADVFAAAEGEVTAVYSDAMLGATVEITHKDGTKTRYSNLSPENLVAKGTEVESGAKIGCVGDSSISELAEEAHLHFEVIVDDASVDPLEYISKEAQKVSLGIDTDEAA